MLPPLQAWLLGAVISVIGISLLMVVPYGLLIYALIAAIVVMRGPRAAFVGAALSIYALLVGKRSARAGE